MGQEAHLRNWTELQPNCRVRASIQYEQEGVPLREETRKQPTCAICKQPITNEERPTILMENGDEVHLACWNNHDLNRSPEAN